MRAPRVMIGLPTMHYLHTYLAVVIMAWITQNKVALKLYPTMGISPVDNARNEIVEEFLNGEGKDCTHLFFIDSDTIPPVDALEKLLALDADIASGLTPIIAHDDKSMMFYRKWNCVDMKEEFVRPNTGIHQIIGAGGSCLLIKREVLEKMEKPHFRFLYQDDNGKPTLISEDIYFLTKANGLGYKAMCDSSIICKHFKSTTW